MILALVGQKGGSGKSTISMCIAAELMARNNRVLLVDADPQRSVVTWHNIAAEHGHPAPSVVSMAGTLHRPEQVPTMARGYDHVLIDTPPRMAEVQRSALMVADIALLPCGPSAVDAWAVAESLKALAEALEYKPTLRTAIIINRKRARTSLGDSARAVLESTGLRVLDVELGYRQAYQEAPAAGLGVTQYAPKDAAATEVRALVNELMSIAKQKDSHGKAKADRQRKSA